jgi:hypothetical protein
MPVISAVTQEAEVKRIEVQNQAGQKVVKAISTNT